MATPKQQSHALVTYFIKKYEERYNIKPKVNRYVVRWGFEDVLADMDYAEAQSLIDYYFETLSTNNHELQWFFYNYDKLAVAKDRRDEDRAALERIRQDSKRRTEEWRKRQVGDN